MFEEITSLDFDNISEGLGAWRERLEGVVELYEWGLNFDYKANPFALFLDLIGYSESEFGGKLYENADYDQTLGFVELDNLGSALRCYAIYPNECYALIGRLIELEGGE